MRKDFSLFFFIFIYSFLLSAQKRNKGDIFLGFSAGLNFANLANTEAPHKYYVYNPSLYIPTQYSDISKLPLYINFKSEFWRDGLLGVSGGISLEYLLKENLSITSGIFLEPKGINLNYQNSNHNGNTDTDEVYNSRIVNYYITLPILIRKYLLKKQNIFVEAGMYLGYLTYSHIGRYQSKTVNQTNVTSYRYNWNDSLNYTNSIDYGVVLGVGYVKAISRKVSLTMELKLNYGLRKVDAKFNNEFDAIGIPNGVGGAQYFLRSTNYQNFNSDSRNINLNLQFGISYKITPKKSIS